MYCQDILYYCDNVTIYKTHF